ncbi:hypothetical protein PT277_07595 [Acetobacteraceae bacterium ESL0709]|nr:hypothetical protein [Acetobacteraceae bacterium ESL0697]MDF7678541.1 hypothetical protein [Acetobacteraceae bacterium ESL0709]
MTLKWIGEPNSPYRKHHHDSECRSIEDFLSIAAKIDADAPNLIPSLSKKLMRADRLADSRAIQEFIRKPIKCPFDINMVLTIACSRMLEQNPSLETWRKIRLIINYEWQITYWLDKAITARVRAIPSAQEAYDTLAKNLIGELEKEPSNSGREHIDSKTENCLASWKNEKYPLEKLMSSLCGYDYPSLYDTEYVEIYCLLSKISPEIALKSISKCKNPFLLITILESRPCFAQWEDWAKAAPSAFDQNGDWTGSILLPLLLSHAREQLRFPSIRIENFAADRTILTAETKKLVKAVVDILAHREDATWLFVRWSTFLMRQVLHMNEHDYDNIQSRYFADFELLSAIGRIVQEKNLTLTLPPEAAPWELWCFQCVLSFFSSNQYIDIPSFSDFSNQWHVTSKDWHSEKGRDLLERAQLHLHPRSIPALSTRLLAFPLASTKNFAANWLDVWDKIYFLRELVEFEPNRELVEFEPVSETEDPMDHIDAGNLLLLWVCIGIACLKKVYEHKKGVLQQTNEDIINLFNYLNKSIMEMLEIENIFYHKDWLTALKRITFCRFLWKDIDIFEENDIPSKKQNDQTICDNLIYLQSTPNELIIFLHHCIINNVDKKYLRMILWNSSISLNDVIRTAKKLHDLRPHKYPIDREILESVNILVEPDIPTNIKDET